MYKTYTNQDTHTKEYTTKFIKVYSVDLSPFYMRIRMPKYNNNTQSDIELKNILTNIFKERFSYQYIAGVKYNSYTAHLSFDNEYSYDVFANLVNNTEAGIKEWADKIFTENFEILYW